MTRWQWLVYMYTGFTTKFRSRGDYILHEKHVVATWHLGDHLSIGREDVNWINLGEDWVQC